MVNVMYAVPAPTPCTTPSDVTVATVGSLEFHLAEEPVRPLIVLPPLSYALNVSCSVRPASTVAESGLSASLATAACTVTVAVSLERP